MFYRSWLLPPKAKFNAIVQQAVTEHNFKIFNLAPTDQFFERAIRGFIASSSRWTAREITRKAQDLGNVATKPNYLPPKKEQRRNYPAEFFEVLTASEFIIILLREASIYFMLLKCKHH
jgi:hypothetical protein